MRMVIFLGAFALVGCSAEPADAGSIRTVRAFSSSVPLAPKFEGYKRLKSQGVGFRKYRVFHPDGLCAVRLDAEGDETLIELDAAKPMVHEETRISFVGEQMADLRRYAETGPGMVEGAPGQVPKYRVCPPR